MKLVFSQKHAMFSKRENNEKLFKRWHSFKTRNNETQFETNHESKFNVFSKIFSLFVLRHLRRSWRYSLAWDHGERCPCREPHPGSGRSVGRPEVSVVLRGCALAPAPERAAPPPETPWRCRASPPWSHQSRRSEPCWGVRAWRQPAPPARSVARRSRCSGTLWESFKTPSRSMLHRLHQSAELKFIFVRISANLCLVSTYRV